MAINPQALSLALLPILRHHAEAGGRQLADALSHPGKGTLHPGNVNPSSLPGDYPAQQTAALVRSLDVRQTGPLTFTIGSYADRDAAGYAHAVSLETRPASRGGRPFFEKALYDPLIHRAILTGKVT